MWFIVILGIIAFLIMEHPVIFWCVFVPLGVMFIITMVGWLGNGRGRLSGLLSAMVILGIMIFALVWVCSI